MIAPTPADGPGSSAALLEHYEQLRENALGRLNRPCRMPVFFQQGMSSWLRAAAGIPARATPRTAVLPDSSAATTDQSFVGILADAVLESIHPATQEARQ